jgi:hypothetical protein
LSDEIAAFQTVASKSSCRASTIRSKAEEGLAKANARATLAEARLSDFKSMLDDIREQRDRWQQQAERLAALAITDQRKEPAPELAKNKRCYANTLRPCSRMLLKVMKGG